MSPGGTDSGPVAEFADGHGLSYAEHVELPDEGGLLGRDGLQQHGTATGVLPGGETGTVCWLTYTHTSDDHTVTVHRTAVVTRLPESIGFAPYLANSLSGVVGISACGVDLDGGGKLLADRGIDEAWLRELLSPALTDWIHRSPDGFEWELADGVLCVSRNNHVGDQADLETLCTDAAFLAKSIREECLEEVDTGESGRTAAKPKDPNSNERMAAAILERTTFDHPPADVQAARAQFREVVAHHPATYLTALLSTLLWMLGANIIGGGIFGLLLNLPNPGMAVLVFEVVLFVVIGFLVLRSKINGLSAELADEGFWREYARSRELAVEEPRTFAAQHAKANLPGAPVRVLTGAFGGIPGSLMITGNGLTRGDYIALVAGPSGPIASADFEVSAPGPSAKALDKYVEDLVLDLQTQPGQPT